MTERWKVKMVVLSVWHTRTLQHLPRTRTMAEPREGFNAKAVSLLTEAKMYIAGIALARPLSHG